MDLTNLISAWELQEVSGNRVDAHDSNTLTDHSVGSGTGHVGSVAARPNWDGQPPPAGITTGQYLSHASNASLVMGDIDFTITSWVYLVNDQDSSIVTKDVDSPANSRDYTLDYRAATNEFRFYVNGGAGGLITTVTGMSIQTWYFLIAWHDATANTLNIQKDNGTVQSVGTGGTAPETSSAEFRLAARAYSGFEGWLAGLMDITTIWKRVLTSGERSALWNGGAGLTYAQMAAGNGSPWYYFAQHE